MEDLFRQRPENGPTLRIVGSVHLNRLLTITTSCLIMLATNIKLDVFLVLQIRAGVMAAAIIIDIETYLNILNNRTIIIYYCYYFQSPFVCVVFH